VANLQCPICAGSAKGTLQVDIQNERSEPLFQCLECSFYFFDHPDWLKQSFTDALHELDLGSVSRCLLVADFVTAVFSPHRTGYRALDWGGGDGLLTRVLRERGVDCVWYDPFAKPRFVGDAVYQANTELDVTVASEVFLHLTDPVSTLRFLLSHSDVVVATAVVPPKSLYPEWWYLMPETGQHVAFYPKSALKELARQTNSYLCTDGLFFHVFSHRRLSPTKRLLIRIRPLAFGFAYLQHGVRTIRVALGRSVSMTPGDQARLIAVHRERLEK
jgi:hypothetical protein